MTGDQCRNNAIPGTDFCYLSSHVAPEQGAAKRLLNFFVNHYFLAACTIFGAVGVVLAIYTYYHGERQRASSGTLSPSYRGTGLYLSVGREKFYLEPSTGGVVLADHRDPILTIRDVGGRLLVSTRIRNEKGDLIAELRDNDWTYQATMIFDRNYNDHVLEIKDSRGEVPLQVIDFGATVHIAGIFRCKNGWTVTMGRILGGHTAFDIRSPGAPSRFEITPVCKYPSAKYLGLCPDADAMKSLVLSGGYVAQLAEPFDFCKMFPSDNN